MSPIELSYRRFPDTITRRRRSPVDYDNFGDRVDNAYRVETELKCAVQPLSLEDLDLVEGSRLVERLKVYVPARSGDLRAAADDLGEADRVVYKGKVYMVEESRTWPKFTRATLLRET